MNLGMTLKTKVYQGFTATVLINKRHNLDTGTLSITLTEVGTVGWPLSLTLIISWEKLIPGKYMYAAQDRGRP